MQNAPETFFFNFYKKRFLFIYLLSGRERESAHKQGERQAEGENQAPQWTRRSPMQDSISGSLDHDLSEGRLPTD